MLFRSDILNLNKIHYWVDFAYLEKMNNNSKYLSYLTGFDICVFDDSYNKVKELIQNNGFYIWQSNNLITSIANPSLHILKNNQDKFLSADVVIQSMLKWIVIWNHKVKDGKVTLGIDKDYVYDKQLFLDIEEKEYCGIKFNVPRNYKQIRDFRYSNCNGEIGRAHV